MGVSLTGNKASFLVKLSEGCSGLEGRHKTSDWNKKNVKTNLHVFILIFIFKQIE